MTWLYENNEIFREQVRVVDATVKIGNGGRGSEGQTGCRFAALSREQMAGKLNRPSFLDR